MKLIHCSDIHLDSRMERNLTAAQARERNRELCGTFENLVSYAVREGVTAVLIAGDLFDTRRVSSQTADALLSCIRQASAVDFLLLRGNHDENREFYQTLPENVKTFGPQWSSVRYGEVRITGAEPEDWEGIYDTLELDAADTNIVMLHGQTATQPGPEQIALPRLRDRNIRYLALGHLHSYQTGKLDLDSCWCYSGCLEGRGFDECGEKGFVLLEVENRQVRHRFIPFGKRTLWEVAVDISDLTTVTQLRQALQEQSAQIPEKDLVKFVLTGTYGPDTQKDLPYLQKSLAGRFYFSKLQDDSRLKLDRASYQHDISLKGEFIRLVLSSDRPEQDQEQIILHGLRALTGEEAVL